MITLRILTIRSNPNFYEISDGPPKDGGESGDKKPEGKKKEEKKGGKKVDPKDIMKKRRERAICIDKVSRYILISILRHGSFLSGTLLLAAGLAMTCPLDGEVMTIDWQPSTFI